MVSRASSEEIGSTQETRGWTMPWLSTAGSDFNDDAGYAGTAQLTVFVRDGTTIFRTYTVSGSVLETIGNHWTLLDLAPTGP
jgi:predicted dithiol-disulfide oxidoreductase (DUF899 family)